MCDSARKLNGSERDVTEATTGRESQTKRVAIFLDRDGVINVSPGAGRYITSPDQIELIPGVANAIAAFRATGNLVIVVTNQRCIDLGLVSLDLLQQIHDRLRSLLRASGADLDDVLVCPHGDEDECQCRKPRPGMLLEAAARHRIDLAQSVMIGDSARDLRAGQAAGCRTGGFAMGEDLQRDVSADASIPDWSPSSVMSVLNLLRTTRDSASSATSAR